MEVIELIRKLKKMPLHAEVGVSAHDNSEWEVSGWVSSVVHHTKQHWINQVAECEDSGSKDMFESNPQEWVILSC